MTKPAETTETSLDYLRRVVDGGFTVMPRWTDEPFPGVAELEETIPGDLVEKLRQRANELNVTLESVLLSAHAKVLAALSGEQEVVTGYVTVEGGQPLPCRLSIEPESWRLLLEDTHRLEAELLTHKDFQVDDLKTELGLTEPMFETVFDPTGQGQGGDLDDDTVFSVDIFPNDDDLVLRLRYQTEDVDSDFAARIAGYHLAALSLIAADPNAEHKRQSLLTEEELKFQIEGLAGPKFELPESRFHELFEEQVRIRPDAIAGVFGEQQWTYAELNARANQLGHALLERGLKKENVVAVVTERNLDWMAAVIGIFKAGGVYLPVEPHFPSDRIATMFTRAECKFVVTEEASTSTLDPALESESLSDIQVLFVEKAYKEKHSKKDLGVEVGPEQAAYVYFTSGSTGEPKGAMCEHEGMVNHLYAKINDLGVEEGGVVSQIAPQCFDISLWQLISGLMVGGHTLIVGQEVILDIPRFVDTVIDGKVTVMQVVPSYLDIILNYLDEHPREFPDLKCVSVTGEAVTMELVERWFVAKPDIKLANAYGLTETSDDTNHEVMTRAPDGDRVPLGPAVINVYIYVVDQHLSPVPLGAPGEIVFSGVCVGRGYLNDPERTKAAFMADPIRKGERLYRSGDFGCWRTDGKLEFLGRRDAQVKISGFRIEIGDIENALLAAPGIKQGSVVIGERPDKSKRLVAFYASEEPLDIPKLQEELGQALPDYMVPSTFHWQDSLPLTANGKIDRKKLTALAAELGSEEIEYIAPSTPTEEYFCKVLSDLMKVEQVSVEGHFFNDLGADSLKMAGFLADLSKREDLPPVDIKDVYQYPTIRSLAAAVTESGKTPTDSDESTPPPEEAVEPVSTFQYVMCGVLQLLSAINYVSLFVLGSHFAYGWVSAGSGFAGIFGRLMLAGGAGFLAMCILPILAKWVLVGRWKPQKFRVWSLQYFRFWLVKTLTRFNPLVLFVGSPIFTWYLRMLGAKIGKNAVILSPHIPVCSDLLTIGDDAVVRKDSFYHCYRAHNGQIHTGPVTIGKNAFVGEMSVLDIDSSLGDGAQLGHSSSLQAGQHVPDGEHRCGSPAVQQTPVDYRSVEPANCSTARKVVYSACLLVGWLAVLALTITITTIEDIIILDLSHLAAPEMSALSQLAFYVDALVISLLFFVGTMVIGLIAVVTVPRLLYPFIKPDQVYPIYGWHYWVNRAISRTSNIKLFTHLFGDSSYIVYYLRSIGYDLSENVVQTGSNFGSVVKHDNPLLVSVGTGTVIADGLSSVNNDYSNSSFRTSRVTIGSDSFLGNAIVYPSQGRVGDNCLLATKVMVPMDGDVLEGVGILGSPNFEIPRTVQRDKELSEGDEGEVLEQKLSLKNKHNLVTIGLFLLSQWFLSFLIITIFLAAAVLYPTVGVSIFVAALLLTVIVRTGYHVLVDRASMLFQSLKPQQCSIYDPHFWSHERFWKFMVLRHHLTIFDGTPLKTFIWRLLGVRIGKRVFDDGCYITEKTLVSIGDGCTLGPGSIIQSHSQEDGGFKSDYIKIGAGCTLGVNAFVHYGVTMEDGAQLGADSFLMKGAEVPQQTQWGGNPASQTRSNYVPRASAEATISSSKTATNSASTASQG
ncbi:MAG: amino acid adenylation domain-containing protein [Verrucomicrobiales bacterium]|nr:amino acid adenylation domain-containing protein [Verrucomicrobiales bacterium]